MDSGQPIRGFRNDGSKVCETLDTQRAELLQIIIRPLQNRVTPTGDIVAVPPRGIFTGNRGIIHDPATRTLLKKRWALPRSRSTS